MSEIKAPKLLEADHARLLTTWLTRHKLTFLHIPNEGMRSAAGHNDARRQGLSPGAPDYLIFGRTINIAIELKPIGWKPRNARERARHELQKAWLARLAELGWKTRVCFGWEDAASWIVEVASARFP